jgi:hypothetical protein
MKDRSLYMKVPITDNVVKDIKEIGTIRRNLF